MKAAGFELGFRNDLLPPLEGAEDAMGEAMELRSTGRDGVRRKEKSKLVGKKGTDPGRCLSELWSLCERERERESVETGNGGEWRGEEQDGQDLGFLLM